MMNLQQTHLCHLKKANNANKSLKPIMYNVHLCLLKLRQPLKYVGKCVIHYINKSGNNEKIKVFIDNEHFTILNLFLIAPCGTIIKFKENELRKKKNSFYIYPKSSTIRGLHKLVIFFYYENYEQKTEGIYPSSSNKVEKKKRGEVITTELKDENCVIDKHRNLYVFQNDGEEIFHFNFKKIKFESKRSFTYINTFCEFFYLPLIFPCFQNNIHKVKFRLKISLEIELRCSNNKIPEKWDKLQMKMPKRIFANNMNKGKETTHIRKKYPIHILSPEDLVVTNSKLKRVYYTRGLGIFTSLLLNLHQEKMLIRKSQCLSCSYIKTMIRSSCFSNVYTTSPCNNEISLKLGKVEKCTSWYRNKKRWLKFKRGKSSNNKKDFITYEFNDTSEIASYTFCLFVGIYDKIKFKVKEISVVIYIERERDGRVKNGLNRYNYFTHIVRKILLMFMRINIFRKRLEENNFLQFMILNKYKYAGEENNNCITLLMSLIRMRQTISVDDVNPTDTPLHGKDKISQEGDNFHNLVLGVKLIIHEVFHTLWGNCLYFKKAKHLWCKEGLTRYYELQFSKHILNKITKCGSSKWKLNLWFTLEYYFYILLVDTLNMYNHTLNINENGACTYEHVINKNNKKLRENICSNNIYTKDIHYFYNALTYNKGMNIFKIISVISRPYFYIIMDFMFYTFYNHSINFRKILKFFHFFFRLFHIKPFFLYCNKYENCTRGMKKFINKKKKKKNYSFSLLSRNGKMKIMSLMLRKGYRKAQKSPNRDMNRSIIHLLISGFIKRPFKKRFKAHCKNMENNPNKRKNRRKMKKINTLVVPWRKCGIQRIDAQSSRENETNLEKNSKKQKIANEQNYYIFRKILQNYINVVGPPKIFLKFFKNKNKLLITQKHFYYDNYEQRFKETRILFHIPFIFTFRRKAYRILLTRKYTLIDIQKVDEKYACRKEGHKLKSRLNTFSVKPRNVCYFSYHFVDMFSFNFILNSIHANEYRKADIIHVITNIIMSLLVRLKSLKQMKRLNSLISRQVFLVYKLLKDTRHTNDESHTIGMIMCEEFFNCYAHFSSYFSKIENRKLKMKINKELRSYESFDHLRNQAEFIFKDFRNYLSKIFFFFKESINLLL
ncbi:M1-family alanyl aminopeptidase [Plasmodium gonderi]|uniref:M1-family alanyl aminopeptidase n=1 Tax=Plasmodium gonderi TaxID=77519 RepID=A0A1Y1JIK8_PLAGO|nr:M1-family alanyl aminopeptidase [Plasmodium gonderi]GAW82361.1 M1-family alanyl aminopeptidase [Plasmodium gonderi]